MNELEWNRAEVYLYYMEVIAWYNTNYYMQFHVVWQLLRILHLSQIHVVQFYKRFAITKKMLEIFLPMLLLQRYINADDFTSYFWLRECLFPLPVSFSIFHELNFMEIIITIELNVHTILSFEWFWSFQHCFWLVGLITVAILYYY